MQKKKLKQHNRLWLKKIENYIICQFALRRHLVISDLAAEMNMSERQFYRRMEQLTGKTPNRFIQEIRMKKARQILESGHFDNIKNVALDVGLTNPDYFSRLYYRFFGHRPSRYPNHHSKLAAC